MRGTRAVPTRVSNRCAISADAGLRCQPLATPVYVYRCNPYCTRPPPLDSRAPAVFWVSRRGLGLAARVPHFGGLCQVLSTPSNQKIAASPSLRVSSSTVPAVSDGVAECAELSETNT